MFDTAQQVELTGCRPGGLGKVVELHGRYYGAEWNCDLAFEADIATDLSGFLQRLDPARDGFWLAWLDDAMVGSITIDDHVGTDSVHLRWFIAEPGITGRGIGASLMEAAMAFCRARAYSSVWLTTFAGLDAARKLYDRHGFVERRTFRKTDWDFHITMQELHCGL